jgi:hypothetical protein
MLSEDWIYDKIFELTKEEVERERANVIEDTKSSFRKTSIEDEGVDPANPPEGPQEDDDEESFEESGPIGRPPEGTKYSTQDHIRGRDPLGSETMKRDVRNRDRSIKHTPKGGSLTHEMFSSVIKSMKQSSLLNENNLLNDESL